MLIPDNVHQILSVLVPINVSVIAGSFRRLCVYLACEFACLAKSPSAFRLPQGAPCTRLGRTEVFGLAHDSHGLRPDPDNTAPTLFVDNTAPTLFENGSRFNHALHSSGRKTIDCLLLIVLRGGAPAGV